MSDENDPDEHQPDELEIEEPPRFDAGDEEQVGRRKRRIDIEKRDSDRFWRAVFASKTGRREMYALLRDCKAFDSTFACGPNGFPQAEATWFAWGEASWGRRMRDTWLVRFPIEFAQMLKDHHHPHQQPEKGRK